MAYNNNQIVKELISLFNEDYVSKIHHSNNGANLETHVEIYRPNSLKESRVPILNDKKVGDFSVYSGRDYTNETSINWLDRDFSAKYAPNVVNFLINHKDNIIRISTIGQ